MGTLLIYKDSANKDAGKVVFENATIIVESEGNRLLYINLGRLCLDWLTIYLLFSIGHSLL